jgi:hypothetical protein
MISQLKAYKAIVAYESSKSPEYQRISKRLSPLEEIKDAASGYNKEIPTINIEAVRFYNITKYLFRDLEIMKLVSLVTLCYTPDQIVSVTDPLTWYENSLG